MTTTRFPENIYGPNGIGQYGSTIQTILLVRHLQKSPQARLALRRAIDMLDTPITYSNQDFDRRQAIAQDLADWIRAEGERS